MKTLGIVVQFQGEEEEGVWHLTQSELTTCCGKDILPQFPHQKQFISAVSFSSLCTKCQEAIAASKVSRAGLVHKKGAR